MNFMRLLPVIIQKVIINDLKTGVNFPIDCIESNIRINNPHKNVQPNSTMMPVK